MGKTLQTPPTEYRAYTVELRAADDKRMIVGHAAVFNTITDLGWFKERVAPGAFTETIKNDDIRALFNHDPNYVIGRNKAGTLRLSEDEIGLYFEADLPDTTWANDLYTSIKRGDISQCSFGFIVRSADWDFVDDGSEGRTLKVVQLWDVSPVTYPAYPTTDASVRSAEQVWSEHGESREDIKDKSESEQDRQGAGQRQAPLDILRRRLDLSIKD